MFPGSVFSLVRTCSFSVSRDVELNNATEEQAELERGCRMPKTKGNKSRAQIKSSVCT